MMIQRIVIEEPPIIDAIDAVFKTRGKPVFYSFGGLIYNPQAVEIGPALLAHEAVHGERQTAMGPSGVAAWWHNYIESPEFRLAEEIPAHRAEYQWWLKQPGADRPYPGFCSMRHYRLHWIADRLSGSLYGNLISMAEAKRLIEADHGQG